MRNKKYDQYTTGEDIDRFLSHNKATEAFDSFILEDENTNQHQFIV